MRKSKVNQFYECYQFLSVFDEIQSFSKGMMRNETFCYHKNDIKCVWYLGNFSTFRLTSSSTWLWTSQIQFIKGCYTMFIFSDVILKYRIFASWKSFHQIRGLQKSVWWIVHCKKPCAKSRTHEKINEWLLVPFRYLNNGPQSNDKIFSNDSTVYWSSRIVYLSFCMFDNVL